MANTNSPTLGNGKICYLEIPATDVTESSTFYQQVFGWRLRKRSNDHIAFDDGVGQVSGTWVLDQKPSTEGGVLISIMVDDAVATLAAIVAHGGKITQPIGADAPFITAHFSDPAGNIFGIYQEEG
ncbi:MAG TPA: VOC family protein [Puia sp.]|nr:VOC family protein [Puia sp.]